MVKLPAVNVTGPALELTMVGATKTEKIFFEMDSNFFFQNDRPTLPEPVDKIVNVPKLMVLKVLVCTLGMIKRPRRPPELESVFETVLASLLEESSFEAVASVVVVVVAK